MDIQNKEYKQPSEAKKAIRVWLYLTESSAKQMSELIMKVRHVHSVITESPLPRNLMWIGLRQAMWKFVECVLAATTLSRNEAA